MKESASFRRTNEIASEVIRDPQVLLQIAVLKAIDDYSFSHAVHVSIYATTLGRILRFSERELHQISMAGLLHDIGKIDISEEILNKPGKLTEEEFNIIKQHVRFSFNRVYRFEGITRDLLSAIGQHGTARPPLSKPLYPADLFLPCRLPGYVKHRGNRKHRGQ